MRDWKHIRVLGTESDLLGLLCKVYNYAAQNEVRLRSRVYLTGKVRLFEIDTHTIAHLVFEAKPIGSAWLVTSNLQLPPEKHYPLPPRQPWAIG